MYRLLSAFKKPEQKPIRMKSNIKKSMSYNFMREPNTFFTGLNDYEVNNDTLCDYTFIS